MKVNRISLAHGSGGEEMDKLIRVISSDFYHGFNWLNIYNDGATLKLDLSKEENLVFTTDSYVVKPLFFNGGNIGTLAFCGTVNDLAVMGSKAVAISLALIIEEGFELSKLKVITETIARLSNKYKIPIVTGDLKVMEKGALDGIIINTSGIGLSNIVYDKKIMVGDKLVINGGIGEHGATLLAKRLNFETGLKTDSQVLWPMIESVKNVILQAKDITRGGLAAVTNELARSNSVGLKLFEDKIPVHKVVKTITEVTGIDKYSLACEGRFIAIVRADQAKQMVNKLQKYNKKASIIGEVTKGSSVVVKTKYGTKLLASPSGSLVPRIC